MILVIAEKEALGKYIAEALPGVEKTSKAVQWEELKKGNILLYGQMGIC